MTGDPKLLDTRVTTDGQEFRFEYRFNSSNTWYSSVQNYKSKEKAEAAAQAFLTEQRREEAKAWKPA